VSDVVLSQLWYMSFFERSESECVIFIFGTSVGIAKFVSVPAEVQILVGRLYSYDCPCGLQSIIIIIIIHIYSIFLNIMHVK